MQHALNYIRNLIARSEARRGEEVAQSPTLYKPKPKPEQKPAPAPTVRFVNLEGFQLAIDQAAYSVSRSVIAKQAFVLFCEGEGVIRWGQRGPNLKELLGQVIAERMIFLTDGASGEFYAGAWMHDLECRLALAQALWPLGFKTEYKSYTAEDLGSSSQHICITLRTDNGAKFNSANI
jgi:hypothetical protein